MDDAYEMYCLTDPVFYDSFIPKDAADRDFALAQGPVPAGWQRSESGDWLVYTPQDPVLPAQGWKIHASACTDSAEAVLAAVWEYCIPRGIPFKFIRSQDLFFLRNVKYSPRGSSGKFVTIYPADEAQLKIMLSELGAALDGQPGPYILSDLRWGDGPLYVRYGGFAERYCVGAGGELELALEDASGQLIPDRRGTTFAVPDWVTLPECLVPQLEARNSTTVADLPYKIERALHFSNGGGVYKATHLPTGEDVVLKEARPHAGLAWDGADAVARLGRERDMLQLLAGLEVVPALRDYFELGGHHFLVEEFVDGATLMSKIVDRYPVGVIGDDDDAVVAEYTAWALDMCARVEAAVAELHDREVVIGDLSPVNMLVRDDDSIVLIDLEVATLAAEASQQSLATSAFMPPATQTGLAVDRYALACLRLFVFLPQLTALLTLDLGKAEQLAASIAEAFPVPDEFLAGAVQAIEAAQEADRPARKQAARLEPDPQTWARSRDSMAAAILASATPERRDRLFPGHPRQFATAGSGLGIAYGAAGVLYALHATGADPEPQHEHWLAERATQPPPGTPLGLYDGLHGAAYVLDRLGRHDDARNVLEVCIDAVDSQRDRLGLDLSGGLAGIGLTLAYFAARNDDAALWERVWDIADRVAERLGSADSVAQTSGGDLPYAGLLRGSAGPALMFLRLYERRADSALLDLAATAIRQDLRRCCVAASHGALHVDEQWRTLPYIADGSVGIGFVVDDYLAHREDEQFAQAAPQIRRAAQNGFYVGPGLFSGRAGMILYLSRGLAPGSGGDDPVVAAHVRRLNWHAMSHGGHLAFPGDQLLRLSMDLGTGTAGVLFALGSALHERPVHLPFLAPAQPDAGPTDPDLMLMTQRR